MNPDQLSFHSMMNLPTLTVVRGGLCALLLASSLAGCHRAPKNSAELQRELPRIYVGELHFQGQAEAMRLRVTPHNFSVRDDKVLEFNGVEYSVLDRQGGVQTQGDANLTGTITLPGLEVRLESVGNLSNGDELVKTGSFQGKLSDDLQTGEAEWTTGLGQKGSLKLHAEK